MELADNTKAHILTAEGVYEKIDKRGKVLVNSQMQFCKEAEQAAKKEKKEQSEHVFIPAEPADTQE